MPLKSAEIRFIRGERNTLRLVTILSKIVWKKKVKLKYVRKEDQLTDLFTKSLGVSKFMEFRQKIGLVKVKQCSDQGGV